MATIYLIMVASNDELQICAEKERVASPREVRPRLLQRQKVNLLLIHQRGELLQLLCHDSFAEKISTASRVETRDVPIRQLGYQWPCHVVSPATAFQTYWFYKKVLSSSEHCKGTSRGDGSMTKTRAHSTAAMKFGCTQLLR